MSRATFVDVPAAVLLLILLLVALGAIWWLLREMGAKDDDRRAMREWARTRRDLRPRRERR